MAATATAVFAARRPSFAHLVAQPSAAAAYETLTPLDTSVYSAWIQRYEFHFVEGTPRNRNTPLETPAGAKSVFWLRDNPPRPIDFLSLAAMSDAFFTRIFDVRGALVHFGTVSLTTYFMPMRKLWRVSAMDPFSAPPMRAFSIRVSATRRASFGRKTDSCSQRAIRSHIFAIHDSRGGIWSDTRAST